MENALLSVVIIAKNSTSLMFTQGLSSILKQLYTPIQIVVVDINEADSVYSLGLQEDLEEYTGVEYVQLPHQRSIVEARNRALDYVKGEFVAFMTSNDIWDSTKALLQMDQLRNNPDAAASCCNGKLFDERKAILTVTPLYDRITYNIPDWIIDSPAKIPAQVIYRVKALREVGVFDDHFIHFCDGDMLLRISKRHKVLILPVSLCESHITEKDENYERDLLNDDRNILIKYLEIFLVNRQMTRQFYARMIWLARENYLWLNYFIYCFMYFIKAPGATTLSIFKHLFQGIGRLRKWVLRELSRQKSMLNAYHIISEMKKGKFARDKQTGKTLKERRVPDKSVSFTSAKEFNRYKPVEFAFNRNVTSIIIPEYVTTIKKSMFYGCEQLKHIEIPNTVTEIEAHAFQKCTSLCSVLIQEGSRLSKVGAYAFAECTSLETISLPSSILQFGNAAFFRCRSLQRIQFTFMRKGKEYSSNDFPTALVRIPRYAFAGCSDLYSVEFGTDSMLKAIEQGAFLGCLHLKKILLTGEVELIERYAFSYCKEMDNITIPKIDSVTKIGKCAFMHCEAMPHFQFPNYLVNIHEQTFSGCYSLKYIKLSKKTRYINHKAFAECKSLEKAVIFTSNVAISATAFDKNTEVQMITEED